MVRSVILESRSHETKNFERSMPIRHTNRPNLIVSFLRKPAKNRLVTRKQRSKQKPIIKNSEIIHDLFSNHFPPLCFMKVKMNLIAMEAIFARYLLQKEGLKKGKT